MHFHVLGVAVIDVAATLTVAWLVSRGMRQPLWVGRLASPCWGWPHTGSSACTPSLTACCSADPDRPQEMVVRDDFRCQLYHDHDMQFAR